MSRAALGISSSGLSVFICFIILLVAFFPSERLSVILARGTGDRMDFMSLSPQMSLDFSRFCLNQLFSKGIEFISFAAMLKP